MSWFIFLGYLDKIMFLDTHAGTMICTILQVRKKHDIFMVRSMLRSCVYQVSVQWDRREQWSTNKLKLISGYLNCSQSNIVVK